MSDRSATRDPVPAREQSPWSAVRPGATASEEAERLAAQVAMSWDVEQRRLAQLGVRDGTRILDVGCGSGAFTARLADWLPAGRVVALDADPELLAVARQVLGRAGCLERVDVVEAALPDTGLAGEQFDVAVGRYVYQHLRDPVAGAREVRRLLRPGGLHVAIDVDDALWGVAEPQSPQAAAFFRGRAAAQGRAGGNRFRGRRLGRMLAEAGFEDVVLDVFSYDSDALGIGAFAHQLDPRHLARLVGDGAATLSDYLAMTVESQRFLADPDAFVLALGFLAWGVRGAD